MSLQTHANIPNPRPMSSECYLPSIGLGSVQRLDGRVGTSLCVPGVRWQIGFGQHFITLSRPRPRLKCAFLLCISQVPLSTV